MSMNQTSASKMAAHTSLDSPLNKNTKILLKDVAIKGEAFSRSEEGAREALIASARSLIMALETPMEAVTWMIWAEVRLSPDTSEDSY